MLQDWTSSLDLNMASDENTLTFHIGASKSRSDVTVANIILEWTMKDEH